MIYLQILKTVFTVFFVKIIYLQVLKTVFTVFNFDQKFQYSIQVNDDNTGDGNNIQSAFNEYELSIEVFCGDVRL